MTDWKDKVDVLVGIAQILAILIGGSWAYFNFVRRRTLHRRAELNIDVDVLPSDHVALLRVVITFRNTGLSVLWLASDAQVCRLYALNGRNVTQASSVEWGERLVTIPIFHEHRWVEAQETISDEQLVALPALHDGVSYLAYKVTAFVTAEKGRFRRSTVGWSAVAVGSLRPAPPSDAGGGG